MKIRFCFLLLILWSSAGFSQTISRQVIGTAGDYSENSGFSVSWTIGEPVTETFASDNYTLYQGFQQGDYVVEIPEGTNDIFNNFDINIYPNPAGDFLVVNIKNPDNKSFELDLFSLNGKKILSAQINPFSKEKYLNLSKLATGTYIIKIIRNNNIQTFKLIKK